MTKTEIRKLRSFREPKAKIHETLLLHDLARLEYGRLLWRNPRIRRKLAQHWSDERHPHHERFARFRKEVGALLASDPGEDDMLDKELRIRGLSLRILVREIPPVFGSFYNRRAAGK